MMTEEPFLILHKVRGLPAFDIAIRCDDMGTPSDPSPWWIIPTSGHRAYPVYQWPIHTLRCADADGYNLPTGAEDLEEVSTLDVFAYAPDHYRASEARSRLATAASDILSILGLGKAKPQEPVKRRSIP